MPFHIIFKPACWRSGLLAGLPVCLLAGRQVSRQASQMAGWTAGRLERGQACRPACVCSHVFSFMQTHIQSGLQAFMRIYNHSLTPSHPLILVLLLGSLGIGKRCFESRNNSTNSNPFAGGFLISREISKVSFGLPEGFSVTAEKWQQQGMFRVTRNLSGYSESLTAGLPSEVGQPIFFVYSNYKNSPWHGIIRFTFNAAYKTQQNT